MNITLKYRLLLFIIIIHNSSAQEPPAQGPPGQEPSGQGKEKPKGDTPLDKMFKNSKIVPTILAKVPGSILTVYLKYKNENKTVDQIDERKGTEPLTKDYVLALPEEPEKTFRFVVHVFVHNYRQTIAMLTINRYWYTETFWKPERNAYSHHSYWARRTRIRYSTLEAVPEEFWEQYPVYCRFLGDKKSYSYDMFLYGNQKGWISKTKYAKYDRLRHSFVIKDFIKDNSLTVTHGVTIKNKCDDERIKTMQQILLPLTMLITLVNLIGVSKGLFSELKHRRALKNRVN